jgi:hypothetical protein
MENFNTPFWGTFGISTRADSDWDTTITNNVIIMLGVPAGWYGNSLEIVSNGTVTVTGNIVS